MSKSDKARPPKPTNNEDNTSGLDVRRNTEALKLLIDRFKDQDKEGKAKQTKERRKRIIVRRVSSIFFVFQLIGTSLILEAWIVQNETLSANSSEIASRENVKAEIRELLIATNLDQSRVDFNSYINHELGDSDIAEHMGYTSLLAILCFDQIKLIRATLKNVPDTATIDRESYSTKKEELSDQFIKDSLTIDRLKFTGTMKEMANWVILQSASYANLYSVALKAGNDHDTVIQEQKDKHAKQWNHWYKLGTIFLILSLLKGVVDVFK